MPAREGHRPQYRDPRQTWGRNLPGSGAVLPGCRAGLTWGTGQTFTGVWGRLGAQNTGGQGRLEAEFANEIRGLAGGKEVFIKNYKRTTTGVGVVSL